MTTTTVEIKTPNSNKKINTKYCNSYIKIFKKWQKKSKIELEKTRIP